MTNEERKEFYMNRNIKMSPGLIALTWDVIFVWTISNLYFTTVKGLSNSQVITLDSILMLCGCLMCVPVNKLFQNWTPVKATRVGLFGYAAYLLLSIFGTNYVTFLLAQPFLAFGYALMGVKSNSVLTQSLHVVKRDKDYQRVYGKGLSLYYIIDSFGAVIVTYIFNWNPFMVYWMSLGVVGICMAFSFFFKEPQKFMEKNVDIDGRVVEQKIKKPDSLKKILASSFFIFFLIYAFFFRGVMSIAGSAFKIYLKDMIACGTIPLLSFGYIYSGSRIANALASKFQFKFSLKFGVKSIIILNVCALITFSLAGVAFIINPTSIISILIIVPLSYVQCSLRTVNQICLNNYLQVCTSKRNQERAYSIKIMVEYLGYAIISMIYAALLAGFNDNYGLTSLTYIGIFGIPLIVSMVLFIRSLIKKHAEKFTVIKDEYTKD